MKIKIALLSLFIYLGSICPLHAEGQNNDSNTFFTIYFNDGTSYNYYSGDIVSMTYSDIDLDGNACEDFVVQEIDLGSRIDRYYLADIQEISFDNVNLPFDVPKYVDEWNTIYQYIDPYFESNDKDAAFELLKTNIEEIKGLPEVSAVELKDSELVITLQDGTSEVWTSFPEEEDVDDSEYYAIQKAISLDKSNHIPKANTKLWVCNTLVDETLLIINNCRLLYLVDDFESRGGEAYYTNKWDNGIWANADIVIYHGHGYSIGKQHYICSGTKDISTLANCEVGTFNRIHKSEFSDNPEHFIFFNEKYFERNLKKGKDKAVYMASCNTLTYNDQNGNRVADKIDYSLCNVFFDKGANAYFGYNDISKHALYTANLFLGQLREDKTVEEAYAYAKDNLFEKIVLAVYKNDEAKKQCYMHNSVSTLPPELCTIRETKATLGIDIIDSNFVIENFSEVGILYGKSPALDLNNSKKLRIYVPDDGINKCETATLEYETDYYYTAYAIKDGNLYTDKVYKFITKDATLRTALKNLYKVTNGDNWKNNKNWLSENVTLDKWYGVSGYSDGYRINLSNNKLNISNLDIKNLPNVYSLDLSNNNGESGSISLNNCKTLHFLSVPADIRVLKLNNCPNVASMPFVTDVEEICIEGNSALEIFSFTYHNKLKICKFSNCSALHTIYLNDNKDLTSLQIFNCPKLETLCCENCNLKSINGLASCHLLKNLDCYNNQIAILNILSPVLKHLNCSNNPISMAYESIPNYQNIDLTCDHCYIYVLDNEIFTPEEYYLKMGYMELASWIFPGLGTKEYLLYKHNKDDQTGFYHKGEPSKEAYDKYY